MRKDLDRRPREGLVSGSRGFLIAIEGVDAVGKKTQTSALAFWLRSRGRTVETISFPDYGTAIGGEIREFLMGRSSYPPEVRHILFAANRWEEKERLEAALSKAEVVLVNRYTASNYAYGVANGLRVEWLMNLEAGLPEPDLVVVLDAPTSDLRQRRARDKDEYEKDASLQERTRAAYLRLAGDLHWRVVDASGGVDATRRALADAVSESLKKHGRTV